MSELLLKNTCRRNLLIVNARVKAQADSNPNYCKNARETAIQERTENGNVKEEQKRSPTLDLISIISCIGHSQCWKGTSQRTQKERPMRCANSPAIFICEKCSSPREVCSQVNSNIVKLNPIYTPIIRIQEFRFL